jgi:hypothetical protein
VAFFLEHTLKFAAFLLVLVSALYGDAFAADVRLNWTPPTQNTDGTPVALKGYTIHFGATADSLTQTRALNVPAASSTTVTGLSAGTYFFCVKAISTADMVSACSNVVSKVIAPATPNAPTNLTVVADTTAYVIKQTKDNVSVVAVGNVPHGTQCSPEGVIAEGKAYYVVPSDAVAWSASVRSGLVVSACS